MPRASCPFLRAVEIKGNEGPIDNKIQEIQEASEFLEKQPEAEGEAKHILQQEASQLSLENRVRSTDGWLLCGGVAEQGTECSACRIRITAVDRKALLESTLGPYLKTGGCVVIKLNGGALAVCSTAQSGHGSERL